MKRHGLLRQEVPYVTSEPFLVRLRRSATESGLAGCLRYLASKIRFLVNYHLFLMALFSPNNTLRVLMYRIRGVKIGDNVVMGINVSLDNDYPELITVGDGVALAGSIVVLAHSRPPERFKGVVDSFVAPVVIEKNVWIGVGAIILPGVTIGEGAIVSAASLVTRDVPPNCLVAGNPARRIKVFKSDESSRG